MDHSHPGCGCPGWNARRNVPDIDPAEMRIRAKVKKAQLALDELCEEMVGVLKQERSNGVMHAVMAAAEPAKKALPPKPKAIDLTALDKEEPKPRGALGDVILKTLSVKPVYSQRDLGVLVGMKHNGSYMRNTLGKLRSSGYLDGVTLTDAGKHVAQGLVLRVDFNPTTLRAKWRDKLGSFVFDILNVLAEGDELTRDQLAEIVDKEPNGSYLRNTLGKLRSHALINKDKTIKIHPLLQDKS
jgi:hypothetical protein